MTARWLALGISVATFIFSIPLWTGFNRSIADMQFVERSTWIERFNQAGVPCGPIYNIGEVFDDPQVEHLGLAQSVNSAKLGKLNFVRQPVTLTRTPSSFAVAPPEAGEHSDEILTDLGYAQSDIDDLRARGVV